MKYEHDKEQANEYFAKTVKRIEREDLMFTPDIYELWYVYYSGINQEVTKAIKKHLEDEGQITVSDCQTLYHDYLDSARNEEAVRRAGNEINETIRSVTGVVNNVRSATSDYSGKMSGFTQKAESIKNPEDLKKLISEVSTDTEQMLKQNRVLEEELNKSASIMEELKRDLENVRKEALTDGLTGLSNRKAFDTHIEKCAAEADKNNLVFSLVMMDIDHFKSFNDNYGHQIGDQVLRLVARTFMDGLKGKDLPCRYGGEEFAIILPQTPLNGAVTVADNLRKIIAEKDVVNRHTGEKMGRITISAGVASYFPGDGIDDLIERADGALYTAKHNGRNQVAAAPSRKNKVKEAGSV